MTANIHIYQILFAPSLALLTFVCFFPSYVYLSLSYIPFQTDKEEDPWNRLEKQLIQCLKQDTTNLALMEKILMERIDGRPVPP